MTISERAWDRYIKALRAISDKAAADMSRYMKAVDFSTYEGRQQLIRYAYALATKYGEAAGTLACEMYDAAAELSGVILPPAVPAATASMEESARAVVGTLKQSPDGLLTPDAIGRLSRLAGVDTTMQNAIRDGAWWAWIPRGDTCAFCITLASNGWQKASRAAMKGNHAQHVHANCDCTYAVVHDPFSTVEGYDPDRYYDMYRRAPLDHWNTPDGEPPKGHEGSERNSSRNRINAMRRVFYEKNKSGEFDVS